jgi:Abortive infection alpha
MIDPMLPILKEVTQIPGLLKEVYGDLAKPGVNQVGKALSTVIGLGNTILWPIALLNERSKLALEKNLERYRQQLENIPPEQIAEVPPEIGVGIAEKLSYVSDEQLSDLYINLLAKASTQGTAHQAHPSFVNVINNLSPDEALLLQQLKLGDIPFVEVRLVNNAKGDWHTMGQLLTGIETKVKLYFPANIVVYLSNFEGLGLINIRYDLYIATPDNLYANIESIYRPGFENMPFNKETQRLTFEKGKIEVTPLGRLFVSACLTKLNQT